MKYVVKCRRCGGESVLELADLNHQKIKCPLCGDKFYLNNSSKLETIVRIYVKN